MCCEFDDDSAQEESESTFIRAPCSAHTANLRLKDLFSKGKIYKYIKKQLKFYFQINLKDHIFRRFSPKVQ